MFSEEKLQTKVNQYFADLQKYNLNKGQENLTKLDAFKILDLLTEKIVKEWKE